MCACVRVCKYNAQFQIYTYIKTHTFTAYFSDGIDNTELFIIPSGISELDCATTKTDTAGRSISIGRESLQVFFFVLGALAYFQVPPLRGSRDENGVHSE